MKPTVLLPFLSLFLASCFSHPGEIVREAPPPSAGFEQAESPPPEPEITAETPSAERTVESPEQIPTEVPPEPSVEPAVDGEPTGGTEAAAVPAIEPEPELLSIAMVGDLMIGINWPDDSPRLPPEDGRTILELVAGELRSADLTFGNLEGVLLDSGGTPKQCNNPKVCYAFRSPERYAQLYADAGFDLMSVANNHTGDFGPVGRAATRRALDGAGIGYAGHEHDAETAVVEKGGVRYGLVAFSVNTATLRVQNEARAVELISELRTRSDILIVSMHIGAEGRQFNRITRKTEFFVGEDRGNPWQFARTAIDAGADLVIGHGPHVLRAVDLYKGKFIAYSLGNFATTADVNIAGISGYAPIITVRIDRQGNFREGKIFSAIQRGESGERRPVPDPTGACIREIKRLTAEDLPEAPLSIDDDGTITPLDRQ